MHCVFFRSLYDWTEDVFKTIISSGFCNSLFTQLNWTETETIVFSNSTSQIESATAVINRRRVLYRIRQQRDIYTTHAVVVYCCLWIRKVNREKSRLILRFRKSRNSNATKKCFNRLNCSMCPPRLIQTIQTIRSWPVGWLDESAKVSVYLYILLIHLSRVL